MAWIPKGLGELPKILAGPLVRKTTDKEISVWLALTSSEELTLNIYNTDGQLLKSASKIPTKIGDNFYICCITAKDNTSFLSPGNTYGYNIVNVQNEDFHTLNFVDPNGINAITFASTPTFGSLGKLPTFVLPATAITDLRIIHGSCRKPHGEGLDALSTLSDLIDDALDSPSTVKRPQMLFLTGDQIYADDVADPLLHMIRAYSTILFNWNESHSAATDVEKFKPGNRHQYIINQMNFPTTIEYCKSHLMGLQEFLLMYVMAWSPSLWRSEPVGIGPHIDALPDFDEVLPDAPQYEQNYNFNGLLMIKGPNVAETPVYERFQNETRSIKSFRGSLYKVRRALANISTYMIFDDHEITDDWFLNSAWTVNALSPNSLQRRVISNGMIAYSLCQGWGNTPEQFEAPKPNIDPEPGYILLGKLKDIATSHNSVSSTVWDVDMANIVLPELVSSGGTFKLQRATGGLIYNWVYQGSNFEVIALDTRTNRAFQGLTLNDGIAYLISDDAVSEQVVNIGETKKDLTFLISGTPLYGSGSVEQSIQLVRNTGTKTNPELDLESWNILENARHTLVSALATRAKTPTNSGDPLKHRVIVLSGDVHYGFTNRIKYNAITTFKYSVSNVELILVQCCASSLKNQSSPAGFIDEYARLTTVGWHRHDPDDLFLYNSLDNFTQWGFNNESGNDVIQINVEGTLLGSKTTKEKVYQQPYIFSSKDYIKKTVDTLTGLVTLSYSTVVPVTNPDWMLIQKSIKSNDLITVTVPAYTNGQSIDDYISQSSNHKDNFLRGGKGGRYIVGYNQLGEILMRWPATDPIFINTNIIDHRLWWRNRSQNESTLLDAYPSTIYVVILD